MSNQVHADAPASGQVPGPLPLAAHPGQRPANRSKRRKREGGTLAWYLMIIPALALIAALTVYPFIQSVLLGFQEVKLSRAREFVGLENYQRLLADDQFWGSLQTTFAFAVSAVSIELVIAWVLALLLWNVFRRMGNVFRVLFAIPMMLSPVVVGVVWRVLLNPQFGWIPNLSGVEGLDLLGQPGTAFWTMVMIDAWHWTPFMFLIIAAGLTSLPDELLEAARMDGAGSIRLFTRIIWPLTLPTTIVAVLFRFLDALKTFDLPYNLTQGGPGTATETVAMYLYKEGFTVFDQGYASALSLITTVIFAAVALLILIILRRSEGRLS